MNTKVITLGVDQKLEIPIDNILGKFVAILGIRGSGKTHTCGVVVEHLLEMNVNMGIIDPEGEFFGLRTQHDILVVGESGNVDVRVPVEAAAEIARMGMKDNIPMVIDLSGFDEDDMYAFFKAYITEVWKLSSHIRKVFQLVFEEVHLWVPQGGKSPVKKIMRNVALRGRKRGLGSIIVGQRSSTIDKDFLTQAEYYFLHKVVHKADMDVYRSFLPIDNIAEQVKGLVAGECFYVDGGNVTKIRVQPRKSYHVSVTPTLDPIQPPPLREANKAIVNAIKAVATNFQKEDEKISFLEKKIQDLEAELERERKYSSMLEQTMHTLKTIEIQLNVNEISEKIAQRLENKYAALNNSVVVDNAINHQTKHNRNELPNNKPLNGDNGIHKPAKSNFLVFDGSKDNGKTTKSNHGIRVVEGGVKSSNSHTSSDLPRRIMNHLNEIVERVQRLPRMQKRVLAFLSNTEPKGFTAEELSSFLDYASGSLKTVLPSSKILRWGMIERAKDDRGFVYRASLRGFTDNYFGGQDVEPYLLRHIETILRDEIDRISRDIER